LAAALDGTRVRVVLLDIEGTTTPLDFVHKTLFPYARRRLQDFLLRHRSNPGIRADIEALRKQYEADVAEKPESPPWTDDSPDAKLSSAVTYGHWLMDRDSKCAALKSLQGRIWQEGYQSGELHGEVFPDVPAAFARWSRQGKDICIFSSGSVLAQKSLFGTTTAGDLTRFIRAYFDTTTGSKTDAQSYLRIAATLALSPQEILFVSDVVQELDAARHAGMETALCVRTTLPEETENRHRLIRAFDEVFP
jgi:enolase-phosphatase E1